MCVDLSVLTYVCCSGARSLLVSRQEFWAQLSHKAGLPNIYYTVQYTVRHIVPLPQHPKFCF